jgi:hypothetical protein
MDTVGSWVAGMLDVACAKDFVISQQDTQRNVTDVEMLTISNRGGDVFCDGFSPITGEFVRCAPRNVKPASFATRPRPVRNASCELSLSSSVHFLQGFDLSTWDLRQRSISDE